MSKWGWGETIGFASLIIAIISIITAVTNDEIRCFLKLDLCQIDQPPQSPIQPTTQRPIQLEWGNLSDYFVISRVNIQGGFGQADSKVNFLVKAKGDFIGSMYAYAYDEDGVKICDPILGLRGCNDEFIIHLSTRSNSSFDDPLKDFWQKGEADRASLYVPYNTKKIRFVFVQRNF